jgi:hypothetical protein
MHGRVVTFAGGNSEQVHRVRTGLICVAVKLQAIMGHTRLLIS